MADEVVYLKNRLQGSAASTVSGSTGSGVSGARMVPQTFAASRVELKGWGTGETFVAQASHWWRPSNSCA